MIYHVAQNGAQLGQLTEEDIISRMARGELTAGDLCWTEGMAKWQPLSTKFRVPLTAAAVNPYALPSSNVLKGGRSDYLGEHPGFWMRLVACIIDAFVMNLVSGGLGFVLGLLLASMRLGDKTIAAIAGDGIGLIMGWLYYALMESSAKQATLGKMAFGIVVTDLNGERISFARATGRYFGQIVSALTLCIGFLMCTWTKKGQCLHDMMAGCLLYRKN